MKRYDPELQYVGDYEVVGMGECDTGDYVEYTPDLEHHAEIGRLLEEVLAHSGMVSLMRGKSSVYAKLTGTGAPLHGTACNTILEALEWAKEQAE